MVYTTENEIIKSMRRVFVCALCVSRCACLSGHKLVQVKRPRQPEPHHHKTSVENRNDGDDRVARRWQTNHCSVGGEWGGRACLCGRSFICNACVLIVLLLSCGTHPARGGFLGVFARRVAETLVVERPRSHCRRLSSVNNRDDTILCDSTDERDVKHWNSE